MKRRELFGSLASSFRKDDKKQRALRPPYFKSEKDFINKCIECDGVCATACETDIIIIQEDKTPTLNFSNAGCTYCDKCAIACPYDVLILEEKKHIDAKITIDVLSCLSWNQTMCFSCKDPCLDDAIDFLALFRPEINDNCTSCGYCIKSCPVGAIKIGV